MDGERMIKLLLPARSGAREGDRTRGRKAALFRDIKCVKMDFEKKKEAEKKSEEKSKSP